MHISIFLAKAIGVYFLIIGIGMTINAKRIKPLLLDILNNPPLLFVTGFIALILGILLVISHNIWTMDFRLLITLIAWLCLTKGTIRVMFPQVAVTMSRKWVQSDISYYISMLILVILGIILVYFGWPNCSICQQ